MISFWSHFGTFIAVAIGGAIAPLLRTFLERLIGFEFDRRMEDFRYNVRVREQAAKTAEYLAIAWQLEAHEDKDVYRRANQLGWELALYLPTDEYRHIVNAVANPNDEKNICTAVVAVRKHLLGRESGSLTANDIALHSPDASRAGSSRDA